MPGVLKGKLNDAVAEDESETLSIILFSLFAVPLISKFTKRCELKLCFITKRRKKKTLLRLPW